MSTRSDSESDLNAPSAPADPARRQPAAADTNGAAAVSSVAEAAPLDPRVRALLESPSFRQADRDPEFLSIDAARGVRLQIDYLKAELLLEQHGVQHTIVVFGGTRIREPAEARRTAEAVSARAAAEPGNAALARQAAVAERILAKSRYYDMARELGRLVGRCGAGPGDTRVLLVTGGGPGIMEAANRGAHDVGAKSVGLNIALPREQQPNPYIAPDLCFRFHYFSTRKLHFLLRARALVAFPGGYGTLDEVFETLTLVQSRTIDPVPVVLVGRDYWRRVFDADFLLEEGVIEQEDRDLFTFAESAEEIWQTILRWHARNGTTFV
jgi:uncharacterized protein (TIGR00730 family)